MVKMKRDCAKHIPVASVDNHNRILDVFCQECGMPMTKEDHKRYFKGNPYNIDYIKPGDLKDIAIMSSTEPSFTKE